MTHEELLTHIIHWRRDLHAIPEMGNSEWETSAYIERAVGETRPDSACTLAGTGKKFVYRCGRAGAPALAFRADMDGLPVTENSIYPYPSRHAGMMHACGHDGHMSALLALAHIAGRMRDEGRLEVDVVLLFQPAEETTGGAARMIEEGALEDPHVCAVFGFHLMPQVDAGTIALSPGGVMAANTEFDLTFRGTRAHGAMPNLGADAAAAVAQAYLALQTFMTRAVPPTEPAVLTFGHMAAGNLRNIVADEGILEGILRSYDDAMQEKLVGEFQRVARAAASVYGVEVDFAQHCYYPPVVNDAALVARVMPLIDAHAPQQPLLTAEDFSFFSKARPGVYAFVGAGDDARRAPLHSDRFDFDERALLPAVDWYTRIIETFAKED